MLKAAIEKILSMSEPFPKKKTVKSAEKRNESQ